LIKARLAIKECLGHKKLAKTTSGIALPKKTKMPETDGPLQAFNLFSGYFY
jgi:hypothetical protein